LPKLTRRHLDLTLLALF